MMNINTNNIRTDFINNEKQFVSLKWYRGASRYNNGATIYGNKYLFRQLIGRAKINSLRIKKAFDLQNKRLQSHSRNRHQNP
jgi:hypothetical protein